MRVHSHLNIPPRIDHVSEAQYGYFTRAQAHAVAIEDYELN